MKKKTQLNSKSMQKSWRWLTLMRCICLHISMNSLVPKKFKLFIRKHELCWNVPINKIPRKSTDPFVQCTIGLIFAWASMNENCRLSKTHELQCITEKISKNKYVDFGLINKIFIQIFNLLFNREWVSEKKRERVSEWVRQRVRQRVRTRTQLTCKLKFSFGGKVDEFCIY